MLIPGRPKDAGLTSGLKPKRNALNKKEFRNKSRPFAYSVCTKHLLCTWLSA